MDKVRIIEIKESIFADNDAKAAQMRERLKAEKRSPAAQSESA